MIVVSPSKILENPVRDPAKDFIGTYRMIVLRPTKILENPVRDPS